MPRPRSVPSKCLPADQKCPKCGAETESIDVPLEGPQFQQLQLCPACYLVTWRDDAGFHVRQGSPMKEGGNPVAETGQFYLDRERPTVC